MSAILFSPRQSLLLPLIQRRSADILPAQLWATFLLVGTLYLTFPNGVASAAAQNTPNGISDNAATAGDADAYLARLRAVLPQNWLQREFQRQRSFPAYAHSRQLVAKGQYEEALQELEKYLASDPDDLVIQFGYLVLASDL